TWRGHDTHGTNNDCLPHRGQPSKPANNGLDNINQFLESVPERFPNALSNVFQLVRSQNVKESASLSFQNLEELVYTSSTDLANIGFNIRKNTLPRIRVLFSSSTRVLVQHSVQVFNRDLAVLGHLLDFVTGNPIVVSQL